MFETEEVLAQRPFYAVLCPQHGSVPLSTAEYERQLNRPDDGWTCPECHRRVEWDDDSLVTSGEDCA